MEIIIIASLKGYTTAISLIKAFIFQNYKVTVLSDVSSDYLNVDYIVDQNFNIYQFITSNLLNPDLIFFCEGGSMKLFPMGLENVQCKTFWYGIDTHMDYDKHLMISNFFDCTFLAQKQYVSPFKKAGVQNVYWLPLAFDISMSLKKDEDRIYDIAFVGSLDKKMHPERVKLVDKLKNEFPNSFFGFANGIEMYKIYSKSKIVFNKSINNDINMRYFEALGNGAILLTDNIENNGVEDIFIKGKHYVEYDESNLISIVKKCLENNLFNHKELQDFVLKNHTYDQRVVSILNTLNSINKSKFFINAIDYLKVYISLENFVVTVECLLKIVIEEIVKSNLKRKVLFFPLITSLKFILIIISKKYKLNK